MLQQAGLTELLIIVQSSSVCRNHSKMWILHFKLFILANKETLCKLELHKEINLCSEQKLSIKLI